MTASQSVEMILSKSAQGAPLTRADAVELLRIRNGSDDFYALIAAANRKSRLEFGNRGYVFAQIGLNSARCSGNCKFCSLARESYALPSEGEKTKDEILREAEAILNEGIDALFLMTTADFDQQQFIDIGHGVAQLTAGRASLVANIGDFDEVTARSLMAAGFTGAYHIVRLREGIDTDIAPQTRVQTLDAIRAAGLQLYYCVEPIGPEHTYEEMAEEMLRAREYRVDVMAVMRRVGVSGTPLAGAGERSELEMTKIAAAARLVTDPKRSMNVHEPMRMPLLAGVNQLYAEFGANPRDEAAHTEGSRGYTVRRVRQMLRDAEYDA